MFLSILDPSSLIIITAKIFLFMLTLVGNIATFVVAVEDALITEQIVLLVWFVNPALVVNVGRALNIAGCRSLCRYLLKRIKH